MHVLSTNVVSFTICKNVNFSATIVPSSFVFWQLGYMYPLIGHLQTCTWGLGASTSSTVANRLSENIFSHRAHEIMVNRLSSFTGMSVVIVVDQCLNFNRTESASNVVELEIKFGSAA